MSSKITHVIFDLDGLLIDTESLFSSINTKLCERYNKEFTTEMEHSMLGTRTCDSVQILLQATGLHNQLTSDEYLTQFQEELVNELPNVKELPGATKLIDYFYNLNVPIGICTGSNNSEFESKTKNFQHWLERICVKVTGCEVSNGKPSPDPYLLTLEKFNCTEPHKDAINGARSAISANTTCILVSNKIQSEQVNEIRPKLCNFIKSLNDFDPTIFDLPPL